MLHAMSFEIKSQSAVQYAFINELQEKSGSSMVNRTLMHHLKSGSSMVNRTLMHHLKVFESIKSYI